VSRSDDERVADILEATDQLAQLVERGQAEFDADFVVRLAVERLLEIIGEAASAMSDEGRSSYAAIEWRGASIPVPTGNGSDAATSRGGGREGETKLFDPAAVGISYARYRGQRIDVTPWAAGSAGAR